MKRLVGQALTKLTGFNWGIIAIKAGMVAAFAAVMVLWGVNIGNKECAEERIAAVQEEKKAIIDFVPKVAQQERDAARREAEMARRQENYNEAVRQSNRDSACDLSDDELQRFQALIEG